MSIHLLYIYIHQIFGIYGIYAQFGEHIVFDTFLAITCEGDIAVGFIFEYTCKSAGFICQFSIMVV